MRALSDQQGIDCFCVQLAVFQVSAFAWMRSGLFCFIVGSWFFIYFFVLDLDAPATLTDYASAMTHLLHATST